MIKSLRTRLLAGIISGMILLLLVFSTTVYVVIRNALINQLDTSLASMAKMLSTLTEQDKGKIDLESDMQIMSEFKNTEGPAYYQFYSHDGTVLGHSPSLGTNDLLPFGDNSQKPSFKTLQLSDGQPIRAVCVEFSPRIERPGSEEPQIITLVVARTAADLQHHLSLLRWILLAASASTIALSFLVAALIVRTGLNPLNLIAAEIASVKEDNLAARISSEHLPAELVPIREKLNDLLSRLQTSFNREKRFTADVAHELRTPLAGMRSTLEVTLKRIRSAEEYQTSLSDCLAITQNMQAMINNLLALARLDAHQMTFQQDKIQLTELVDACWRDFADRALQRNITFDNRIGPETSFESDIKSLSMMLSNLLNNAVEYTNKSGKIWTTARKTDGSVEIIIANTGCKLTAEQASQVFDYFWRADTARTNTGLHCGLGLALVQKIAKALGGSANVELHNDVFEIRLTLPA